jgi:hypothetical protein
VFQGERSQQQIMLLEQLDKMRKKTRPFIGDFNESSLRGEVKMEARLA